jgi:hypothetical protein
MPISIATWHLVMHTWHQVAYRVAASALESTTGKDYSWIDETWHFLNRVPKLSGSLLGMEYQHLVH